MPTATGTSNHPPERPPSFFKVIRYPSAPHLSLPKAFVRTYLPNIPRNPTIVTETGDHSWKVEFVKIGEDYCFAHGWEKLATDAQLCIRDIVVFWLVDPKTFRVSFLGENGCERYLPVNKTNHNDNDDDDDDVVKDDGGECHHDEVNADEKLYFEKVLSGKTFRYHMKLPIKFVKAAGLEREKSIKLKDHEGKEWTMGILAERYSSRAKYSLSRGWAMFRRHHKLSDGDVCKFTFNKKEGVLNLTQVFKCKRPIKQEPPMEVVMNRRPHCYNVKIEDDWDWFPSWKPYGAGAGNGSAGVEVKIEDGSSPETAVGKRKRGLEKPSRGGGVQVNTEALMERALISKHVVYF